MKREANELRIKKIALKIAINYIIIIKYILKIVIH